MSCYNRCTRVNLTSQLLLTRGKHADSHWNKPEHRFALWFAIQGGWERGRFQDVGHAQREQRPPGSLPRSRQASPAWELCLSSVVPNPWELTNWRWRNHLPSAVIFFFSSQKGECQRETLLPTRPGGPVLLCGLCWGMLGSGAAPPWHEIVLHQAGTRPTRLTPVLVSLCFSTDFLSNLRAEQK